MKKLILCQYVVLMSVCLCTSALQAQNTAITDSDSYNAHSSAVLDVYSTTKGMLLPRLTTDEMNAITTPAAGLMVFNSDSDKYYFYTGTSWLPVSGAEYFQTKGDTVFITGHGMRMGVGDTSPMSRLSVKGDPTATSDAPLFEVKNSAGDIIFAVYENEVKVNFKESAKGVKGGFAVGGLSGTKADPVDYMRITPDSVRIYIDDSGTKGVKGGFAVGGLSGTKAEGNKYFMINDDSARIYIKDPAKGVKGGFAVGGLSGTKASKQNYFTIERDSARIYLGDPAKGVKGGFAVGGLSGTKSGANYLDLTPENYLIGHGSGTNITTGSNNSFFGYYAGLSTTSGSSNVFVGPYSGYNNQDGYRNVFIGWYSGYSNIGGAGSDGDFNVFLGTEAGRYNTSGYKNIFIGNGAGKLGTTGRENIVVGNNAGQKTNGQWNVYIGGASGYLNEVGSNNTYLGYRTGFEDTSSNNNTFIGALAGNKSQKNWNTFVGSQAGQNVTTGLQNCAFGYKAATDKVSGNFNSYYGNSAGENDTEGFSNSCFGYQSGLFNYTGMHNTYMGAGTGRYNRDGDKNVAIGNYAGSGKMVGIPSGPGSTYYRNVLIGYWSGYDLTTGSDNVFVGHQAGDTVTSGSNKLYIANKTETALIYGEFDNSYVRVEGDFHVTQNAQFENVTSGAYANSLSLTSDGTLTTQSSDRRLKDNVVELKWGLDKVMKLNPVSFNWKANPKGPEKIGLIAQEVEKILPEVVFTNSNDGYMGINYSDITPVLINAIQEQQSEIEALKRRLVEIEKRISK